MFLLLSTFDDHDNPTILIDLTAVSGGVSLRCSFGRTFCTAWKGPTPKGSPQSEGQKLVCDIPCSRRSCGCRNTIEKLGEPNFVDPSCYILVQESFEPRIRTRSEKMIPSTSSHVSTHKMNLLKSANQKTERYPRQK